jgi:general transcription factor 3C polypeptide 5 (transcription factor C subunit 1)
MARYIESRLVVSDNILIKVSAPKWTGRKRKRGSNEPFQVHATANGSKQTGTNGHSTSPVSSGPDMLKVLRDNPDRYTIGSVGHIKKIHRFRSLPDYQYATSSDPVARRLRDAIMATDYSKIKQFSLDPSKAMLPGTDVAPAAIFQPWKVPVTYDYKQTPWSKTIINEETGEVRVVNTNPTPKLVNVAVSINAPEVPAGPIPDLEPEESLDAITRETIKRFREELEKRPLLVKRVQENLIKPQNETYLRRAWPYVGYMFRAGPFRDSLIKFGVDPRKDPKYRKYQTLIFQPPPGPGGVGDGHEFLNQDGQSNQGSVVTPRAGGYRSRYMRKAKKWPRPKDSHIFDGTRLCRDGKTWQVCDITDPILLRLINVKKLRETCDVDFSGWYGNGTWAVLRTIMKEKIKYLAQNKPPRHRDEMFETLIEGVPEIITDRKAAAFYQEHTKDSDLLRLSGVIRMMAHAPGLRSAQRKRMRTGGYLDGEEMAEPLAENAEGDQMDVDKDVRDEVEAEELEDEDEQGEMDELDDDCIDEEEEQAENEEGDGADDGENDDE